jgi:hypothetical protein
MRGVVLMAAKMGEAPLQKKRVFVVLAGCVGLVLLIALWSLGAVLMRGFLLH